MLAKRDKAAVRRLKGQAAEYVTQEYTGEVGDHLPSGRPPGVWEPERHGAASEVVKPVAKGAHRAPVAVGSFVASVGAPGATAARRRGGVGGQRGEVQGGTHLKPCHLHILKLRSTRIGGQAGQAAGAAAGVGDVQLQGRQRLGFDHGFDHQV